MKLTAYLNGLSIKPAGVHMFDICNRGKNFRTVFQQLGGLRALTNAPFMALTASAPPSIEDEVKSTLELNVHDCVMVSLPLDWPNIYILIQRKSSLSVSVLVAVYILFVHVLLVLTP